jgi:hypothetical protein
MRNDSPAEIAAADQIAAGYNDMVKHFPKIAATFEATFDPSVYEHLLSQIPFTADIVGGPLDGAQVVFAPGNSYPEMLAIQFDSVTHWHRRVVCSWWTCYEWVMDLEDPT